MSAAVYWTEVHSLLQKGLWEEALAVLRVIVTGPFSEADRHTAEVFAAGIAFDHGSGGNLDLLATDETLSKRALALLFLSDRVAAQGDSRKELEVLWKVIEAEPHGHYALMARQRVVQLAAQSGDETLRDAAMRHLDHEIVFLKAHVPELRAIALRVEADEAEDRGDHARALACLQSIKSEAPELFEGEGPAVDRLREQLIRLRAWKGE